jgi:hypothetical protein
MAIRGLCLGKLRRIPVSRLLSILGCLLRSLVAIMLRLRYWHRRGSRRSLLVHVRHLRTGRRLGKVLGIRDGPCIWHKMTGILLIGIRTRRDST